MAITAILVDRARTVGNASTGERIEGTTRVVRVEGTWFRCRLFLEGAPESASFGHQRTVAAPQIIYAKRDTLGQPIELTADMRLEVESVELQSTGVWELTEDPLPLRRRRSVLGHLVTARRADEHGAAL